MPKNLPKYIFVGKDKRILVKLVPFSEIGEHGLGFLDTDSEEIVINSEQPLVGQQLILLHEMIHLATEVLMAHSLVDEEPSEEYVTHLAEVLFPMLVFSGLWNGVDAPEVMEFMKSVVEAE